MTCPALQSVLRTTVLFALFVSVALIVSPSRAADSKGPDAKGPIDGRWKMIEITMAGRTIKADVLPPATYVIAGGKMQAFLGEKLHTEVALTVDATKKPMTYELRGTDRKGKAIVNKGVCEIDDKGNLRMCFADGENEKVPTSFDPSKHPGSQLNVLTPAK